VTAHREVSRDPITGVQIRIGVMGSASEPADPAVAALCRRLGRTVAERGACLLTGACPGLPHETVLGAKETGGHVVGVSPAATLREHVETFGSPYREYDVLIFTGLGLMGRELGTAIPDPHRPSRRGSRRSWAGRSASPRIATAWRSSEQR
jgi:hypothetical protein